VEGPIENVRHQINAASAKARQAGLEDLRKLVEEKIKPLTAQEEFLEASGLLDQFSQSHPLNGEDVSSELQRASDLASRRWREKKMPLRSSRRRENSSRQGEAEPSSTSSPPSS